MANNFCLGDDASNYMDSMGAALALWNAATNVDTATDAITSWLQSADAWMTATITYAEGDEPTPTTTMFPNYPVVANSFQAEAIGNFFAANPAEATRWKQVYSQYAPLSGLTAFMATDPLKIATLLDKVGLLNSQGKLNWWLIGGGAAALILLSSYLSRPKITVKIDKP
jgi:hypothetical protein